MRVGTRCWHGRQHGLACTPQIKVEVADAPFRAHGRNTDNYSRITAAHPLDEAQAGDTAARAARRHRIRISDLPQAASSCLRDQLNFLSTREPTTSKKQRPRTPRRAIGFRVLPLAAALLPVLAHAQRAAPAAAAPSTNEVEVAGAAPVPGTGIERDRLPYSVFTAPAEDIEAGQAASLPEVLSARLPSVQITETQGNPFQPEVTFRGFQASPLLGSAQALSVFLDGMRLNKPFGDVVNFDLIPLNAIDRVTPVGGSQPAFGPNALGGALALTTENGRTMRAR